MKMAVLDPKTQQPFVFKASGVLVLEDAQNIIEVAYYEITGMKTNTSTNKFTISIKDGATHVISYKSELRDIEPDATYADFITRFKTELAAFF